MRGGGVNERERKKRMNTHREEKVLLILVDGLRIRNGVGVLDDRHTLPLTRHNIRLDRVNITDTLSPKHSTTLG